MEDNAILLKIKRQFTKDESIQSLLKIISSLELDIGTLKSELSEAQYKTEELRNGEKMTKKQWMKNEMFEYLNTENKNLSEKNKEHKKLMEYWRTKYFNLFNEKNL